MSEIEAASPLELENSSGSADATKPRRMTLNMGPQHPSTHGVLRMLLELDGETILKAQPDIGFLHTGIEKQFEAMNWQQVTTLTDRIDYLSNLSNNLCYASRWRSCWDSRFPPRRSGCASC